MSYEREEEKELFLFHYFSGVRFFKGSSSRCVSVGAILCVCVCMYVYMYFSSSFVRLRCMYRWEEMKMSGSGTSYQVATILLMSVGDGFKEGATSSMGHLLMLLPVPGAAPSVLVPFLACQPQKILGINAKLSMLLAFPTNALLFFSWATFTVCMCMYVCVCVRHHTLRITDGSISSANR